MESETRPGVVIRPDDGDEFRRALADLGAGRPSSHPVSARIGALTFQFGKRPGSFDPAIDATVFGPFCSGCRRALLAVSFSEWSTAEEGCGPLPEACPHCGAATLTSGTDLPALRSIALTAFRRRIAELP